jgi:AcrR family transcriptional regulator
MLNNRYSFNMTSSKKKKTTVFSREKWLETALETLAEHRSSKFRLETLLEAMPVTKGSFYSHFSNRHDFLLALVDFWDRHYTKTVITASKNQPENTGPRDRLLRLVLTLHEMDLLRFELLFRSMTLELPEIRDAVKAVDEERYTFAESILANLGFKGDELDFRTRMFLTVIGQESNLLLERPKGEWTRQLEKRIDFLTRP